MPNRRNVYFFYKKSDEIVQKVDELKDLAKEHNFINVTDPTKANIIVSIGDDGTFLQAVRKTHFRQDCLYVGISTTGSLSMYCDFDINNIEGLVEAMTNEQIEVRRYPTLEVSVDNEAAFYCLNECSIRSPIIKTFVMDVYIDDLHFETFRGDGMIVATPTGSTAYNKSVSGAVVDPLLPCLQVTELASLNNNLYRTLGSSFILSNQRKLSLTVVQDGNDFPIIGMDNEAVSIQHVERLDFTLSDRVIKTVKLKDNSYWEKVKRSFL
ncbi:NAD kinase [Litchfieldia salsa]|uniref:NAD kinase n=1 Tax=Litchfieldia salsa TaxID=930152 RepID=A0A1H0P5J8_9BACI|nr:NAD kinase [Litchfieldia salsa]SDP00008.1 NAD+ kinase [Litchfieldia salsa]